MKFGKLGYFLQRYSFVVAVHVIFDVLVQAFVPSSEIEVPPLPLVPTSF